MKISMMKSDQLQQAVELSDRIFLKQPEQPSMGVSFPPIFSPGISHSYGAWDQDKLVSFMGFVPFTIQTRGARLNIFSIGSVCTDPDYRGQRLAGNLLEQCMRHGEASGASLILISGGRSLYTRAGSRLFGRALRFRLSPAVVEPLRAATEKKVNIRAMQPHDLFQIQRLMEQREAGYVTTASELNKLLDASAYSNVIRLKQQVLVAEEDGALTAFAIIAVPGDTMTPSRESTLVEWGGSPEAAALIIADAVASFSLSELTVPLPWQDKELAALIQSAGTLPEYIRNEGTIYLVSGPQLLRQLAPLLPEGLIQAEGEHGPYRLTLSHETLELDDEGLLSILFDPESPYRANGSVTFDPVPLPYTTGLQYI
ncbi:GNAT family N-acetyltransferase [Paenibacillus sp. JNUCC32]|uniref:GNAT family N-acetyltransferase n=1 Tax=Paenibacillus sp. JNUCC32 TaxID=2777984 RepID=UPI0017886D80|nr:GNAT family N-acetyltransferase [Paenibacillus sp. JNUCC-32]QOT08127.1 GNAT family N-acetyltransferase [Paenibacillus sp. JNUCC-32]